MLEASTHQQLDQDLPMFNLPSKILCTVVELQVSAFLKKYIKTKERLQKNALKDRPRYYGYENAINAENRATVEKVQLSENLC